MIMADKIIDLRKKNGWSQEELAEQLGVSRQSVSKWEGAQSVPDLNKVIAMAQVFGVSTDYLLKDDMEAPQISEDVRQDAEYDEPARRVSMEEANTFLNVTAQASREISLGVMLIIFSPILILVLTTAAEAGRLSISVDQGGVMGAIFILILVAIAVLLFVKNGLQLSKFDYLEKEMIDTEYGVTGMVKVRKDENERTFTMGLIIGILLCVLSAVPILVCVMLNQSDEILVSVGVSLTLAMIAIGVWMIVRVSIVWEGFKKLLEEGDYTRIKKKSNNSMVGGIYWALVTAGYLGYSFITMDWKHSWIVWPIAGILYGVISQVVEAKMKK
ncbi:MAG: helix-turn-helix domain-containing protein [Clostridiales bacterium]|nr:helix-turn-helix domain-containing protein [Clostridiales bacterium]